MFLKNRRGFLPITSLRAQRSLLAQRSLPKHEECKHKILRTVMPKFVEGK